MTLNGTMGEAEANTDQYHALASAAPDRRLAWLVLLASSAVFLVSAIWRPPDEPIIILCPFRALTGLLCPGCGMTRAFCALGHGELRRAIGFNALSPLLFLAFIVAWIGAASTLLNLHRVRAVVMRLRPTPTAAVCILALVMVWWVVRLAGGF
jgi:uncharacterized protein DUF2752